jgi:hypothetical protein
MWILRSIQWGPRHLAGEMAKYEPPRAGWYASPEGGIVAINKDDLILERKDVQDMTTLTLLRKLPDDPPQVVLQLQGMRQMIYDLEMHLEELA